MGFYFLKLLKKEEFYLKKHAKNDQTTDSKNDPNQIPVIPYAMLLQESSLPKEIDLSKKEVIYLSFFIMVNFLLKVYLSEDEFIAIFKMNKSQFAALPKWRQVDMKKKNKLF